MKMFKKLMAVALVGVMALSMLTGCALTDAAKEDALLKAMGSACSALLAEGKKVTFKSDDDLDKVAKDAVDGIDYDLDKSGDLKINAVDAQYAVSVIEIKKSTNTFNEFKNEYVRDILLDLIKGGVDFTTGTNKVGVKFFDLKDEGENETHYFVIVVAEVDGN